MHAENQQIQQESNQAIQQLSEQLNLMVQSQPGAYQPPIPHTAYYMPHQGDIATDQTGAFPVKSSKGNQYLLVLYAYDPNAISAEPLKSRKGSELLRAFQNLTARLTAKGFRPRLQCLDNEASNKMKKHLKLQDIDFQLVPPHNHRRNAAERTIRTFKNHFIAILCSTDTDFPMTQWDELLPQAELTINLLRASRINPKLSAWAQLHGHLDFNRTPMAPSGTKVIVYETPTQRSTWAPHGLNGFYVGPAIDHYRCYRCTTPHGTTSTRHHFTPCTTSEGANASYPCPTSEGGTEPISTYTATTGTTTAKQHSCHTSEGAHTSCSPSEYTTTPQKQPATSMSPPIQYTQPSTFDPTSLCPYTNLDDGHPTGPPAQ
ncbi:unnamed protein product [Cylindrotheca closterium]|uniref:Integrase catalytic domain-containing protein n=1 Tax=Cylindrotheca closterium TaxID=2856 RepID=A0AAD2G4G9_9STRA|nr:unnamed protein product [Cylindrotheca closterium]